MFWIQIFSKQIYQKWCCVQWFMQNKPCLYYFMRESTKNLQWRNFACNLKYVTILFDCHQFNAIAYTKYCRVPRFVPNKPSFNQFMRKSAKNAEKTLNTQRSTKVQAYEYSFRLSPFQKNKMYQIVFCVMFRGQQTKIEPLYTRKCQKRIKYLKNPT